MAETRNDVRPVTVNRRDFLRSCAVGAATVGAGWGGVATARAAHPRAESCIVLFLVGGPSQLDTWDPKPSAPVDFRGPFRAIQTNVPGIHLSENFPLLAQRADRFAIVRSVCHDAAPIHETGCQLLQTGQLSVEDQEQPHFGAVISQVRGGLYRSHPFVILPRPIGNTGVNISHGQGAGVLGAAHAPTFLDPAADRSLIAEPPSVRQRYGQHTFGQSCLLARRLVEAGTRTVTVNMFDGVFNQTTWDCHAAAGALPSTLDDYRRTLCPMFDQAFSALLDDLQVRGLLASTLVVAMGEFGRTPRLNRNGGRDHWPGCWSILFAGGGVRSGQVIGASDHIASEPRDRPVSPTEVVATILHAQGIRHGTPLGTRDGRTVPLRCGEPIRELFAG